MDIRVQNLSLNRYYHIFNRGINGGKTFSTNENYRFFLSKVKKYISPYFEIYAYCLMPNHFHFLLKPTKILNKNQGIEKGLHAEANFHSKQIGKLISSYSQAYNKINKRHGPLFESPFKRKEIESEEYLKNSLIYIHHNTKDLRLHPKDYEFCSYAEITDSQSYLVSKESIDWFGDLENFISCHNLNF